MLELPLSLPLRLSGPLVLAPLVALVLAAPIALPWRVATAIGLVLIGAHCWRRFLRRRPVSLALDMPERIDCLLADGRELTVQRIEADVIRPWLISARLFGADGEYADLLVPAGTLQRRRHWRLRRALLRFRPLQADAGKTAAGAG